MSFSKSIPLSFLLFCLLHHAASGASPLYHICFSKANYTAASSPYHANLKTVLNLLSTKVPPSGFGVASRGTGPNKVNGLALCRGDVSSSKCKTCVVEASKELRARCPSKKGAVIWYDHCMVKYSNGNFVGEIDNTNKFYKWSIKTVSNPSIFNKNVKKLLSGLSDKASSNQKFYKTGVLQLDNSKKLYGLVQCTRDLSRLECKKCLDAAITELPKCCDAKRGGRVVGASCNFRYELSPFV
ncbi:cysteine-rich repeat secretory protein 38-like [Argentina anserina]|uniref:cysteine-rich repeat secretory protein 38-like n=1 Tax=Argentina anserina TaxID=57926 RepID=UPI0021764BEB|nr:cysteine-rich repeat secretory protein 38-like [Potentilla anserina]